MLWLFFLIATSYIAKTIFIFFYPSFLDSETTTVKDWFHSVPDPDWDYKKKVLSLLTSYTWLLAVSSSMTLTIIPEKLHLCFIFILITFSLLSPIFSQSFKTLLFFFLRLSFKRRWKEEHWIFPIYSTILNLPCVSEISTKFVFPKCAYIIAYNCHPIYKTQWCVTENF